MTNRKFLWIWTPILAIVVAVVIVANVVIGQQRSAIESYMGTGSWEIENVPEASDWDVAYYESEYGNLDDAKANSAALVERMAAEGMTLVKNEGALPLSAGNVTLLGRGAADPVYGGSGSGGADTRDAINIRAGIENGGFSVNDTVYAVLDGFAQNNAPEDGGRTNIVMDKPEESNYVIGEMPVDGYSDEARASFAEFNDAAIVVIGRGGGEGGDLATDMTPWDDRAEAGQHQLQLDQDEKDMLALAKENFDTVIVLINASTSMELGELHDDGDIDSILLVGSPGLNGFNALGRILSGEINPSGHTTDIYSRDFTADPTFVNVGDFSYSNIDDAYFVDYEEGIYMGYRYYETAAVEGFIDYDDAVVYPFGYGLSYTDFAWSVEQERLGDVDGDIEVDVTVTNTGDVAGQDVVQLYYTAPYTPGGVEKAHVVLGDFAKTSLLEPGEAETVTVSIPVEAMASYDWRGEGAYVLDEGTYELKIQTDSHRLADGTEPIEYVVDSTISYVDGRASDVVPATNLFDDMSEPFVTGELTEFSRSDFAGTFPTAPENDEREANDTVIAGFEPYDAGTAAANSDAVMPTTGASGDAQLIDLRGLDKDDPLWSDLLDQLTTDDMTSVLLSGAYNTAALPEIGKIRTDDIDGPAGFSSFINPDLWQGTAFPSNFLIAMTWNADIAHEMGVAAGNEALNMGVNGWYAPAVNIHRSPFAGRNFEYYSEDPVLSAKLATQVANGALEYGVYTFTKHYAMNDQEVNRVNGLGIATWATEQATREIYLKAFEDLVKDVSGEVPVLAEDGTQSMAQIGLGGMMSSFNLMGTTWAGGSHELMTGVLRDEWGFDGFVITDFNLYDFMYPDQGIAAGSDLMLTFDGYKQMDDTSSAHAVTAMRTAMHNLLFTVANSNAMNGMAPGATLEYVMAGWEIAVIGITIALSLLILAGIAWVIIRVRRHRVQPNVEIAADTPQA
ncbi:beta-glucosidase [Microbacterium amylolyticum]|uniref:Beta-glucosidase n=1 Tax=Microbacterium amylolyticum TaxID=936337 RepID=A0ABS4ZDR3_9MICO|nr:glycoside hydrolase family 3 N-terminal domain-containing protein [Microbacterium amylolyticum]MBP2435432.1 beta-glucosidase [Microbacterium amylolyticum]